MRKKSGARAGYLKASVASALSTRNLPVLRPYSVSTPMMATMISGGTPYSALAFDQLPLVFQPETHAAVDAAVVQEARTVAFPRALQRRARRFDQLQ